MQPDFIGIGAQKAGTSWIYACLDDHPDIHVPIKEIHFFSKPEVHARGLDWYCRHFSTKKPGQVSGEFSTTYLHSDEAIRNIAASFPRAKILVSLRDPISRAKSHFGNDIKAGLIARDASLAEMLSSRPDYIERGLYAAKLKWLFDAFGRDNVLVLVIEDSYHDPEAFMSGIYKFLGVDETFVPPALHQKINISEVPRSLAMGKFFDRCSARLRTLGLGGLVRFLRHIQVIEFLRGLNRAQRPAPPSEPIWNQELVARLEQDRLDLEALLDRPLQMWTSALIAAKMDVPLEQ
jgi:hypothetical protein